MRSVFVAFLVSTTALLAGCSDDGGHGDHAYTCPDGTELDLESFPDHDNETFNPLSKCPKRGSTGNTTTMAPNKPPLLSLKTMDDGGNVTNVTVLMGNLTFSAEGSSDPDGSITGIAVTVTDSNTTRTASLYDPVAKAFKPATFKFDRPGIVNVSVAMVDDRAGFTSNTTKVYVNHPQTLAAQTIQLPGGGTVGNECDEGDGGAIIGATYFKGYSFALFPGATFVEAVATATGTPEAGTPELTICDPANQPVSPTAENAVVSDQPLPPPTGIQSYRVGVTLAPGPGNTQVVVDVIVHYEPQSAAAPPAEE